MVNEGRETQPPSSPRAGASSASIPSSTSNFGPTRSACTRSSRRTWTRRRRSRSGSRWTRHHPSACAVAAPAVLSRWGRGDARGRRGALQPGSCSRSRRGAAARPRRVPQVALAPVLDQVDEGQGGGCDPGASAWGSRFVDCSSRPWMEGLLVDRHCCGSCLATVARRLLYEE